MAKERLVLVDGSWLIFRAFFAIPSTFSTKDGIPTNATYGFATMFRKLFGTRPPERGAVVFDSPEPTFREQRFPQYKAQRPAMANDLRVQLPWIDQLVSTYRFPLLRKAGLEADDIIATLALQGAEAGMDVTIIAGDKDLAQMVVDQTAQGGRIRMQDTMRDVTYDEELVRKKWGVAAKSIPDLLAIMGDTVDNIPGVPGIGQKGAAALIAQYGSIDGILANLDALKGKQKTTLEEHREKVREYRELATVESHADVGVGLESLTLIAPDPSEVQKLHQRLEFYSLLSDKGASASNVTREVADLNDPARMFSFLSAREGRGLALCVLEKDEAALGLGLCLYAEGRESAFGSVQASSEVALQVLADHIARGMPLVVHDWKTLTHLLVKASPQLEKPLLAVPSFDTRLASFLIEPAKCIPHRLDQVAKEYVQEAPPGEAAPFDQRAAAGADLVARLGPVLKAKLADAGMTEHYANVEVPLSRVLFRMEQAGILVDAKDLVAMGVEFRARKLAIEKRIYELAGHEFNIGSTKQLAEVLFEELKLPVIKKTKTGYSTDAEVLERLAPKHEIAREILAQRELAKLINTYTDVLGDAISPVTGRVHTTFQQTTGVSGRLITTNPDLQRTPVRTPEGERIRRAFIAPPGMKIISADWSQIELRVLAHFSEDEALGEAFEKNLDLHRQTASILFKVAPEAVTKEQRNVGKTVNFATIYGQGATALGQILGVPRKEAQGYIEEYFTHYEGVRTWLDETIETALETGYVTTLLGRRRVIPELSSRNEMDKAAGERIAANTPIQGSAADLCKLAMLTIAKQLPSVAPGARMLLQIHDELVFEVPEAEVEAASACIRSAMENPYPLSVPLVVGLGVGASWGDAK